MEIEEKLKEQIVDTFLKHWDAVSVRREDFGKSDLLQFDITLIPGATPIRAKCRGLNPFEINVARNLTTGITPFYALYGGNARLPLDVVFPDGQL